MAGILRQKSLFLLRNSLRGGWSRRNVSKDIRFGDKVRRELMAGVDILADAVAITLGPKGRNVVLEESWGPPKITKDGVTVAKCIELKDKFKNMGAQLVQDVSHRTNEVAGDGTTTATLLAREIASGGLDAMGRGINPSDLRRGIMMAVEIVKGELEKMRKLVTTEEEIQQVATISANGDTKIGSLIAKAINQVGKDGAIAVKEGKSLNDELEIIKGIKFDQGYTSPYFTNVNKGSKVEYKDVLIAFSDKKLTSVASVVPVLELAYKEKKPLVVIADDVDDEALTAMVINRLKLGLKVVAVKPPGFGTTRKANMKDFAVATGGILLDEEGCGRRIEDVKLEQLGRAGEIIVSKNETVILKNEGKQEEIEKRVEEIKSELARTKDDYDIMKIKERISRLTSGVAIVRVGGSNEVEVNEKKDRVTDAINATKAAIESGILPGGGTALLKSIPALERVEGLNKDQQMGLDIVKRALCVPTFTIAKNAGVEGSPVVEKVMSLGVNMGYDALKGEYVDMFESGIIDPVKVVATALRDAAGIASLIAMSEAVIAEIPPKELPKYDVSGM